MKKFSQINEGQWAEPNRIGGGDIFQEVEVYVTVSGDYCAFHEMSFGIDYDITNNIQLSDFSLDELKNWDEGAASDAGIVKAIKIGDKYYIDLESQIK